TSCRSSSASTCESAASTGLPAESTTRTELKLESSGSLKSSLTSLKVATDCPAAGSALKSTACALAASDAASTSSSARAAATGAARRITDLGPADSQHCQMWHAHS